MEELLSDSDDDAIDGTRPRALAVATLKEFLAAVLGDVELASEASVAVVVALLLTSGECGALLGSLSSYHIALNVVS